MQRFHRIHGLCDIINDDSKLSDVDVDKPNRNELDDDISSL